MKTNLPLHWKLKKLGDVCLEIMGGGTPSTNKNEFWDGNIPWITSADILGIREVVIRKKTNENGIKNSSTNLLPKGSIIVVTRVGLGKIAIAPCDLCFSQDCQGLVFKNEIILNSYALFFLSKAVQVFKYESRGTTINGVTKKQLVNLQIPIPPLAEQEQIVAKIEELFSELDAGVENIKTAQEQLKVYRQSLLKWAFEGKLTNEDVKDGELLEGWKIIELKKVCRKIQDGSHFSPKIQHDTNDGTKFLYITAKNIRNDKMDLKKISYVDKSFHESIYSRCNPEYGDVLLTKDGVNTGEVTLNSIKEPISLLSSVCLIKTDISILLPNLLKYYIQSPVGRKNLLGKMSGTAIKRIILKRIKDLKIPLPPLSEQLKIVEELESRLTVCDKLEEDIKFSLARAESLRQSILKQAFEGKLLNFNGETDK